MAEWLPTTWLDKINDAQRRLSFVIDLMDRMDECGMDCQEVRQLHSMLFNKLELIKNQFFPQSPPAEP